MKCTVFYSWQSDLPNATNRGFIQGALERAVKAIRDDDSIHVEPVVDRDTQDVPGAPDISSTILAKIDQAQIFVADVSIINGDQAVRRTPNPNVLIELGYALRARGWSRVVMVMNLAYGALEELPFDLRQRRIVPYTMPQEAENRAPERNALQQRLTEQMRAIVASLEAQAPAPAALSPADQVVAAVEVAAPNEAALARRFMEWVRAQLVALAPDFTSGAQRDDLLVQAVAQTPDLVAEFARVAQSIAAMNAREAAEAIYKGFEQLAARYYLPPGFGGGFNETDFDFYKFVGHELFVTLFSRLIREDRWELVAELLDEDLFVENQPPNMTAGPVRFHYMNDYVRLLDVRNQRLQLNKTSLHGEILKERHAAGPLADVVPWREFMETDYFLFLRSEVEVAQTDGRVEWIPWSAVYMDGRVPRYLAEAVRERHATRLVTSLGAKDLETLRERLLHSSARLRKVFQRAPWFLDPMAHFDVAALGTK